MARQPNAPNLKRGDPTPQAQVAGLKKIQENREEEDRLADLARENPYAAFEELHSQMTRHLVKLIRREARSAEPPAREITDRIREYRQLTETLNAYLEKKGAGDSAASLFSSLDERLAQANLSELSPSSAPDA